MPVNVTQDHMAELEAALASLGNVRVLVGIPNDVDQPHLVNQSTQAGAPEKRPDDEEGGITSNATLGYIHEHGSPAANIPARPWLAPGVESSKTQWLNYLRQAGEAALEGNQGRMERALHAAGTVAVSGIKNRIVAGLQPPLSQRTIDARRRRTPSRQAQTQEDVTPLVDTAQMLNSISYVIKRDRST